MKTLRAGNLTKRTTKPMSESTSTFNRLLSRIYLPALIVATCAIHPYANITNSSDSTQSQIPIPETPEKPLNIFSVQTSLPFGWLDNVYSGYSFITVAYSRIIPMNSSRTFGIVPGIDFVFFQFASYSPKYAPESNDGVYVTFPIRINLSAQYNWQHISGYSGITMCVPIANFDPFFSSHAETGITANYWQSHIGLNYKISKHFELGIKTNIAFTKFHAEDGSGYDNNIVLSGSILY